MDLLILGLGQGTRTTSELHFTCGHEVRIPHESSSIKDLTKDDALRSFHLINMGSSCMGPDWSGIRQEDEFVDQQFMFSAQGRGSCD
ncbi:hypothetical protein TNCV_736681 [Trichonephila clavipes]|nr:hypothetical protein TNCV_736681 [Trichonephila clavipes]